MPDALFCDPRLVAVYDAFDDDRSDLDAYVRLARDLGARHVLDVGCGTGVLALLLAAHGIEVTGVDPAAGRPGLGALGRGRAPRRRRGRRGRAAPRPHGRRPTARVVPVHVPFAEHVVLGHRTA